MRTLSAIGLTDDLRDLEWIRVAEPQAELTVCKKLY
jgi:hypothetical protein